MTHVEATAALVNPAVLEYRVKQAEKVIESKADKEYVDQIASEVRGLRKAVISLMAAIVGSSVLVSLTLFATLGSHLAG
jgi:hypothetical protein